MIAITNNIFLFKDNKNNLNTYLVINDNNDFLVINPTIDSLNQIFKKFELESDELINIIFNHNLYLDSYKGLLKHLNEFENPINLYVPDFESLSIKINDNITLINIEHRIEIGFITIICTSFPGLDDSSYIIRYKEFVFTGYCLDNKHLITQPIDKNQYKDSFMNFINNIPDHYFVCPTIGTCDFKKTFVKKLG